jgi:TRAP-type mannitol/chloroaromatic compound transport system substrate-binding protein
MNRRDVITTAGAVALWAALPAGSLSAAQPGAPGLHLGKRLRLACAWPQAAGGTHDAALTIARAIETAVDGAHVDVIAVTDANAQADDISFSSEHAHAAHNPALAFIAGLPGRFTLPPDASAHWLNNSGAPLWRAAAARSATAIPLYAGCEGVAPSLWSRDEIVSLAGLKIAGAEGMIVDLLAACGAAPVEVHQSLWASALASGDVDAVHVASLEDALTLGVQRHAKHCLPGALMAHGGPLALRVPAHLWSALTPGARQSLRTQVAEAGLRRHARSAHNHAVLLAATAEAYGLRVHQRPPRALQITLDRLSEAIVADCSGRDALCRSLGGASMAELHAKWKTALCITDSLNNV